MTGYRLGSPFWPYYPFHQIPFWYLFIFLSNQSRVSFPELIPPVHAIDNFRLEPSRIIQRSLPCSFSRDSWTNKVTAYELDGRISISNRGKISYFCHGPNRLWGVPSILSFLHLLLFLWGQSGLSVKLMTFEFMDPYLHPPIHLRIIIYS
jgi:hypothetical protein